MALNVSKRVLEANIRHASRRLIPWLERDMCEFKGECAIVGGAPSVKNYLEEIKDLPPSTMIFSVNGTHDYLLENGIFPDYFVMMDARPCNDFVNNPQDTCVYMLASQCHRKVFDALDTYHVLLWHADTEDFPHNYINRLAKKRGVDEFDCIASKGTVGVTTIALAHTLGFKKFRLYGMDSSFDEEHHAYKQEQNDNDKVVKHVINGKTFNTTPALCNQMHNFTNICILLDDDAIVMRSEGLIREVHLTRSKS